MLANWPTAACTALRSSGQEEEIDRPNELPFHSFPLLPVRWSRERADQAIQANKSESQRAANCLLVCLPSSLLESFEANYWPPATSARRFHLSAIRSRFAAKIEPDEELPASSPSSSSKDTSDSRCSRRAARKSAAQSARQYSIMRSGLSREEPTQLRQTYLKRGASLHALQVSWARH